MAECRYWGMCRICYGSACDGASATCDRYEPMPDVDALTKLADRMEHMAGVGALLTAHGLATAAASIREALGANYG